MKGTKMTDEAQQLSDEQVAQAQQQMEAQAQAQFVEEMKEINEMKNAIKTLLRGRAYSPVVATLMELVEEAIIQAPTTETRITGVQYMLSTASQMMASVVVVPAPIPAPAKVGGSNEVKH